MKKKLNSKIRPPRLAKASHPSRGEFWNPKSIYPYWEIPKNKLLTERAKELRKAAALLEIFKEEEKTRG